MVSFWQVTIYMPYQRCTTAKAVILLANIEMYDRDNEHNMCCIYVTVLLRLYALHSTSQSVHIQSTHVLHIHSWLCIMKITSTKENI